jgi:uncharacterized delta-60 repeat protein
MWTVPGSSTQRIVAAGDIESSGGANTIAVARYNTDGTLDTSYGNNGIASTTVGGGGIQTLYAMAVQSNGAVTGAGTIRGGKQTSFDVLVARYSPNGAPDTSFNGTGWVETDINRAQNWADAVGLQSTGKIVVAGYNGNAITSTTSVVLRYTTTGQLDSGIGGFGQTQKNGSALGYTITPLGSVNVISGLVIQPDDKIVTVGYETDASGNDYLTLMRFTANGILDTTFNGGSPVLLSAMDGAQGAAVALQPVTVNGQTQTDIVVAGSTWSGVVGYFLAARYNPNGTLDTTFNNGSGWIGVHIPSADNNGAGALAIDSNGRIVVGGSWGQGAGSPNGIAVVRLTPNGTLDTTFNNGSGFKSEPIASYAAAGVGGLAIGNDGNYYVAGSAQPPTGPDATLLAYFTP